MNMAVVTPLAVLSVAVPRVAEPSLKVMTPVGLPAPETDPETVALNVTACPKTEGLESYFVGSLRRARIFSADHAAVLMAAGIP